MKSVLFALLFLNAIEVPFELTRRHMMLNVTVNGKPMRFMLDTGDKYGVIERDRARELGLQTAEGVHAMGTGAVIAAQMVRGASYSVAGVDGVTQPIVIAMPLSSLEPKLGAKLDGVIGADFIAQFVVEIDYRKSVLRLHDRKEFAYGGPGESIPIRLNHSGHPIFDAEVTPVGRPPIKGEFVLDLGASHAVMLRTPVVTRHALPGPGVKALKLVGGGGVGGKTVGKIARIDSVRIGKFVLKRPLATFAEDTVGDHASTETVGSIGQELASRFRIFLDYSHSRIIFEPLPNYDAPFPRAVYGASIDAVAPAFKTFRVADVAAESPAALGGLKIDDVLREIDGRAAEALTLSGIIEVLEKAGPHKLVVLRGSESVKITFSSAEL